MFTARYELSPCINQKRFICKGLSYEISKCLPVRYGNWNSYVCRLGCNLPSGVSHGHVVSATHGCRQISSILKH